MIDGIKVKNEEISNKYNVTDAVFQMLRDKVTLIDNNIIVMDDSGQSNPDTMNILFDRAEELIEGLDCYWHVINLKEAKRPNAKTREVLNRRFNALAERMNHTAFCIGNNILIRTAIYFVMYASGNNSFSICKTEEEAIKKCRDGKRKN